MARRTSYILLAIIVSALLLAYSCNEKKTAPIPKPQHTFSVKGSVREMSIQPEVTDFPEHEGKAEFMSYCAVCHSLRYISQQPDFPRKTWEAEVAKMVTRYKAPIDSVTGAKIVDYLVAIKTKS